MTSQKSLPLWMLIVSGIIALMEIFVSISLLFSSEDVLETVDLKAKGVDYVVQMWAVRQFALGFIFAFATLKKSVPMLMISYIFFLVMFAGDLAVGILQKENALIIAAIVMCLISAGMIFILSKLKMDQNKG
jgi:hypothetical protein